MTQHILTAYLYFFALDFAQAKQILDELNQLTFGTNLQFNFALMTKQIVYDLSRSELLPEILQGDQLAFERARVGDFLRLRHWTNCRFERHSGIYTVVRCLMGNGRDEALLPVDQATARQIFHNPPQNHATLSSCRLHQLFKTSEKFEIRCQLPLPKTEPLYRQVATIRRQSVETGQQKTSGSHQGTLASPAERSQAAEKRKETFSAKPVRSRPQERHQGIAGVVEIPRLQRKEQKPSGNSVEMETQFESDRQKNRFKYQKSEGIKEY
jgi:hypothetical protein